MMIASKRENKIINVKTLIDVNQLHGASVCHDVVMSPMSGIVGIGKQSKKTPSKNLTRTKL
jgi:hypothetical protein